MMLHESIQSLSTHGKEIGKSYSEKLTTSLFWMLRARFAYFKVLRVSSALISAGLMQAIKGNHLDVWETLKKNNAMDNK
jgi:hypothetical protein